MDTHYPLSAELRTQLQSELQAWEALVEQVAALIAERTEGN